MRGPSIQFAPASEPDRLRSRNWLSDAMKIITPMKAPGNINGAEGNSGKHGRDIRVAAARHPVEGECDREAAQEGKPTV